MPKRLVCVKKGELAWQEYDELPVTGDRVRVEAEYGAAKHGTEMSFYKGYGLPRGPYDPEYQLHRAGEARGSGPFPVGNMLVGQVVEVGDEVEHLDVGDRVCFHSGFRPMAVVPEGRCFRMPEGMSWKSAVCVDPAEFALGAVRDGHVRIGDAVAVFGMGAIGLMVVQAVRLSGADPIIAVDPLANRRAVAEELGATMTLDPTACDAGLEIKEATDTRGVDVAIDYSGAMQAVQHALRGVAYGGTVVLGAYPPPYGAGLDLGAEAHMNIPNIVFSRACSQPDRDHPRWDEERVMAVCWRLLAEDKMTGEPIVDPVVPAEDLLTEYPKIAEHPEQNVKLGVRF
jgi:threonine dehydrogenase-like Zn-dependent dehydrogenase